MTAIYECDGCGKHEHGITEHKPHDWYTKTCFEHPDAGFLEPKGNVVRVIHACSRPCIEKAAEKFETHDVVIPI